jgi:hypothetical protein
VPNAPAASCALCSWSMHTSIHSGGTGYIRHSPRDGFTAYIALSPGTGLSCPRRFVDHPAKLNASVGASGPHDFAVRSGVARLAPPCVHRIPLPTSVTIAIRPSCGGGIRERMLLIWGFEQYRRPAAQWHDGQFMHDGHARSARRANQTATQAMLNRANP